MASPRYPDVPDAPGVPPVRRAPDGLSAAVSGAETAATIIYDLASLTGAFSPALGSQLSSAANTIAVAASVVSTATTIAEQIKGISSIPGAAAAVGQIGALVSVVDPQLGRQIASAAALATDAYHAIKALLAKKKKPKKEEPSTAIADKAFQWGIYTQDGALAIEPDNIVGVGYSSEFRIADYPLEQGGFESYDKVALPFGNRITLTKGGPLAERQDFLSTLEAMRGDRTLYNVVTPERTYLNVNIERVAMDRTAANGATLLTVEIMLREVRQSATFKFSKTKIPASATPTSAGSVQPNSSPPPGDIR